MEKSKETKKEEELKKEIEFTIESFKKELNYEISKVNINANVYCSTEVSGLKALEQYEDILECGFKHEIGYFQKKYIDAVLEANLASIVGKKDWEQFGSSICKKRNIDLENIKTIVAGSAPRRIGKSFALAMCTAARAEVMCLYKAMHHTDKQTVFSTGKRVSLLFKSYVLQFLQERNMNKYIIVNNEENLHLKGPTGAISQIFFFPQPASEERLRGVNSDAIYLEEAGFMHERIYFKVVLPLLQISGSILCMISSPPKVKSSWYAQVLNKPGVKKIRIELLCQICKELYKKQLVELKACAHVEKYFPSWHDKSRKDTIAEMYQGKDDDYAREMLGIIFENETRLFFDTTIEKLIDTTYNVSQKHYKASYLIVTCDPNVCNTETSDEMALVATCYQKGRLMVWEDHKYANILHAI